LWNFALNVKEFDFKTIQDVIEENNQLQKEVAYLKDILEETIKEILRVQAEHTKDLTGIQITLGQTSDSVALLEEIVVEHGKNITRNTEGVEENSSAINENAIQGRML
jgi:hypothetical protein